MLDVANGGYCTECSKPEYGIVGCDCCLGDYTVMGDGRHCCPYHQYLDGSECKTCHATCLTCSGPAEDECTGCYAHTKFKDNKCTYNFDKKTRSCAPGYKLMGPKCIIDKWANDDCELGKLTADQLYLLNNPVEEEEDDSAPNDDVDPCANAADGSKGCIKKDDVKMSCYTLGFPYTGYCKECHMDGDDAKCDCCYADYVLHKEKACCAYNQYYDEDNNSCEWCHPGCLTCHLGLLEDSCTSCMPGMAFENGTGPGKCVYHEDSTGVHCTLGGDYVLLNKYKCIHIDQYNDCEKAKGEEVTPPHNPDDFLPSTDSDNEYSSDNDGFESLDLETSVDDPDFLISGSELIVKMSSETTMVPLKGGEKVLIKLAGGDNPDFSSKKGQECEGDCDNDDQCATGLKCFQRNNGEKVPGCKKGGKGDRSDYDYCYDPTNILVKLPGGDNPDYSNYKG